MQRTARYACSPGEFRHPLSNIYLEAIELNNHHVSCVMSDKSCSCFALCKSIPLVRSWAYVHAVPPRPPIPPRAFICITACTTVHIHFSWELFRIHCI